MRGLQLTCDVDAIPEGTLIFPNEPLIRVRGPVIQCQLVETALLTILNFQSLIATKAARVRLAAKNDAVIEFGLRHAQGFDGGLTAARAAYIGGCDGTSNLQAGERFGIPVSGTQAHSWIMFFDTEMEAFRTYARAMPNNCVFLVDTYNSLDGVRHAIDVGRRLRSDGHEMIGVRLDSGDRASLSIEIRRMLDEAGFTKAKIVCSGDLDEFAIAEMKKRGAKIDAWGVGTKLITGQPDAALGGIYKLAAVRKPARKWRYRIKLSDDADKTAANVQRIAEHAIRICVECPAQYLTQPDKHQCDEDEENRSNQVDGYGELRDIGIAIFGSKEDLLRSFLLTDIDGEPAPNLVDRPKNQRRDNRG